MCREVNPNAEIRLWVQIKEALLRENTQTETNRTQTRNRQTGVGTKERTEQNHQLTQVTNITRTTHRNKQVVCVGLGQDCYNAGTWGVCTFLIMMRRPCGGPPNCPCVSLCVVRSPTNLLTVKYTELQLYLLPSF